MLFRNVINSVLSDALLFFVCSTQRRLFVRVYGHMGKSSHTDRRLACLSASSIRDHVDAGISFGNFEVIVRVLV